MDTPLADGALECSEDGCELAAGWLVGPDTRPMCAQHVIATLTEARTSDHTLPLRILPPGWNADHR